MSALRSFLHRWGTDRGGGPAIELALVLPVFAVMVIGAISASQLMGAMSGLNYAVGEAARCSAVNETVCGPPGATEAYARSKYRATAAMPVFTVSNEACGHTVRGVITLQMDLAFRVVDVPLTATACFPSVNDEV